MDDGAEEGATRPRIGRAGGRVGGLQHLLVVAAELPRPADPDREHHAYPGGGERLRESLLRRHGQPERRAVRRNVWRSTAARGRRRGDPLVLGAGAERKAGRGSGTDEPPDALRGTS